MKLKKKGGRFTNTKGREDPINKKDILQAQSGGRMKFAKKKTFYKHKVEGGSN